MDRAMLTMLIALSIAGCASEPLKPWHRDILSQPQMQLTDDPMLSGPEKKIFFSREASRGVSGMAGGGCGCN